MLSSTGINVQLYLVAYDLWAQRRNIGVIGRKWWEIHECNSHVKDAKLLGHLGGSVSWASDFSSGHDLTVCEFEPRVGLCADASKPGAASHSVSPSVSAPPLLMLCLSLSQK